MWPPMNPRVSIVTPSFNQARFLEAAIQSVLQQECESLDYRVLDGGSQDGSVELLRRYDSQLRWVSEPDAGQSDAVNRGFQQSSGEILGWLNADDVYCSGALKEVVRQFSGDPGLMLLYGDAHHIDENGKFLDDYPTREFDLSTLAYHCFICQPACFFDEGCWRRLVASTLAFATRWIWICGFALDSRKSKTRSGVSNIFHKFWRFRGCIAITRHCRGGTMPLRRSSRWSKSISELCPSTGFTGRRNRIQALTTATSGSARFLCLCSARVWHDGAGSIGRPLRIWLGVFWTGCARRGRASAPWQSALGAALEPSRLHRYSLVQPGAVY